jgi:hypothetical protein
MVKKIISWVTCCLLGISLASAQSDPGIKVDAQTSAGLTSTERAAQAKVDLFTGVPDVSIPLFNYNNHGLNLDISVNYFAGGIKVQEVASEVGLGWSLNAGGIIIRNVRGLPDDYPVVGYKYQSIIPATPDNPTATKFYKDSLDAEADLFSYSVNGLRGNFFIAKDGSVVMLPQSKTRIEPVYNPNLSPTSTLAGFKVTTEDGMVYLFNDISTTETDQSGWVSEDFMEGKEYPQAWHLSKMITPFATDTISFLYKPMLSSLEINFPKTAGIEGIYKRYEIGGFGHQQGLNQRIASIILPGQQTVEFRYKRRYDGDGGIDSLLSEIRVLDKNNYKYGYRFQHYYVNSDPYTPKIKNRFLSNYEFEIDTVGNGLASDVRLRSFLKSITPMSANGIDRPYEFEYNSQYFLPMRWEASDTMTTLSSRDYFGFFNGKFNNTPLPSIPGVFNNGADRSASTTYTLAGSIKKITFPNGGTREFEFESNDRTMADGTLKVLGGGLRLKRLVDNPGTGQPSKVTEYKYVTKDGLSSGYTVYIPEYSYAYKITAAAGTSTITVVSSEPVSNQNYSSGNFIGYSRVEVLEGTGGATAGKTIYEFTNLADIGTTEVTLKYPYSPLARADWGLGLPKKVEMYDAQGQRKKVTTNSFNIVQTSVTAAAMKSLKVGLSEIKLDQSYVFIFEPYYPLTGRSELTGSVDSTFYDDGTFIVQNTTWQYHPANYKVTKVISDLDRQKGLKIERRTYYTDDYNLSSGAIKLMKDQKITAVVANEEWITGDANPRMTGGEITDYQQLSGGIIRPSVKYTFRSTAPVPQSVVGVFNPAVLNRKSDLFKVSGIFEKYDARGVLLQAMNDAGLRETMVLMGDKRYPVAKIRNARYDQVAYTSFEEAEKGNWEYSGTPVADVAAATGGYVYNLASGLLRRTGLETATSYILSFWAKGGTPMVTGGTSTSTETNSITGWTTYRYKVTNQTTVSIQGTGVIDEVRLYPAAAQLSTLSYMPFIGMTSTCDAAGRVAYYEYDRLNRLALVRNSDKHIVQKQEFGYNNITHTNAIWEYTGASRCQQSQYGNTGWGEAEQVDANFNSATYMSKRWVVVGKKWNCSPVAAWQNTGNKRCKTMSNGNNTGEVELEQQDVNTYSPTYNQKRWISGGIDRQFCPDLCIGDDRKIINGTCEIGRKTYTRSKPLPDRQGYYCFYVYTFSDGTQSIEFREEDIYGEPCEDL